MKRIIVLVSLCVMSTLLFGCSTEPTASEKTPNASDQNQKIEVPVQVTFLGHSAVMLESGGKTVIVDPWIKDNPKCTIELEILRKQTLS